MISQQSVYDCNIRERIRNNALVNIIIIGQCRFYYIESQGGIAIEEYHVGKIKRYHHEYLFVFASEIFEHGFELRNRVWRPYCQ